MMSDKKKGSESTKKTNTVKKKIGGFNESKRNDSGRTSITGTNVSKNKKD